MIPKIIHYCWFGDNDKPEDICQYIKTWRQVLPDYEIREWNESNFSLENAPIYVKEAYSMKKYAFVSDYVRIWALMNQGGIYFDTDLEVVNRFDEYIKGKELVLGFESDQLLITAFIAAKPKHPFIVEFEKTYWSRHFLKEDGTYDDSVINYHFSKLAERWGVDLNKNEIQELYDGMIVYPIEFFCGFDIKYWHVRRTERTCTIHHMSSSWAGTKKKIYFRIIYFFQKVLGYEKYDVFKDKVIDRVRRK